MKTLYASIILAFFVTQLLLANFAHAESQLLVESKRQLSEMKVSAYQHKTEINEAKGIFKYDCSGFISSVLKKTNLEAYKEISITKTDSFRPRAIDFYDVFSSSRTFKYWKPVIKVVDLLPGDLIVWLKDGESTSTNTGHIMIADGLPHMNPKNPKEILISVIDSALSGHSEDTREKFNTGLGRGTIGIVVGSHGKPIGYHWRGGQSTKLILTSIVFGRVN